MANTVCFTLCPSDTQISARPSLLPESLAISNLGGWYSWQERGQFAESPSSGVRLHHSLPSHCQAENPTCRAPEQALGSSEARLLAREANTWNKGEDGAEGSTPANSPRLTMLEWCPGPYKNRQLGRPLLYRQQGRK